ncbi:MAG: hypothetical protein ACP5HG_00945 [Anaerolineae bacterium]
MMAEKPGKLILIGGILVVLGFVVPLMMVLGLIRTTFLISILAHSASVGGLFLGFLGVMLIVRVRRDPSWEERFESSPWSDDLAPRR